MPKAKLILNIDKTLDGYLTNMAESANLSKCEMVRVCICNTIATWMAENEQAQNDTTVANFAHESTHASG